MKKYTKGSVERMQKALEYAIQDASDNGDDEQVKELNKRSEEHTSELQSH